MSDADTSHTNADQIQYWNETAAPKWLALQRLIDSMIEPFGTLTMDRAAIGPGADVVDVGCGCGQTSLELGRRVAPGGTVLGVDVSAPMLARAAEDAAATGLDHVRFLRADAQEHGFAAATADVVFSRFGVMFFADPSRAFANLRRSLRADGRLAFVCWQALRDNPWMLTPLVAAAEHLTLPEPPAPGAPGPFAFADADRLRDLLEAAGFADIEIDGLRRNISIGTGDLDATVDFALQMGPTGSALREADPTVVPRVRAAVRDALAPHATPAGVVLEGAAWIVHARSRS